MRLRAIAPRAPRRSVLRLIAVAALLGVAAVLAIARPPGSAAMAGRGAQRPDRVSIVTAVNADGGAARTGSRAPDFEWLQSDGSRRHLSELRGAVVVVNLWATWCGPCRMEMPALERVAAGDPSLIVLVVDAQERESTVVGFFEQYQLQHLVPVIDGDGAVARRYGAVGLPNTFVIRPDGTIATVLFGGPLDEDTIRASVESARGRS